MPKPMRKYKADISAELQRDELVKLRERVTELEGHRERWWRLAWRYLDALEGLSRAALTILVQPVREPFVVPLVMRGDLQDARNRAEQTIAEAAEPTTTEALLACAREAGRELRHLSSNGRNVNAASVADRLMSALAAYEADHSTPHKGVERNATNRKGESVDGL